MKLRATLTPTATPAPAVPKPTPAAAANAPTKAVMAGELMASTVTAPTGAAALPIRLSATVASVRDSTTLVDSAPPPLTATPVLPAATDTATATAEAEIVPSSAPRTVTSPPSIMLSATEAVTSLSMVLWASERPIATPTAVPLPGATVNAPPAVTATIRPALVAVTERLSPAATVLDRTAASVLDAIRLNEPVTTPATFTVLLPAPPLTAPPPASAVMLDRVSAATVTRPAPGAPPPRVRSVSRTKATVVASMPL